MKKSRKLLMILGIVLSLAIATGSTLAYLTDTDSDVNVMTLGNVDIEQHEFERVPDGEGGYELIYSEKYEADGYKVQPFTQGKPLYPAVGEVTDYDDVVVYWDQLGEGASGGQRPLEGIKNEQDKFVLVENTGKSDAYVRTIIAYEVGSLGEGAMDDVISISRADDEIWTAKDIGVVTIEENDYFVVEYTYHGNGDIRHPGGVLPAGEYTYNSLAQVYMMPNATNEDCEAIDGNGNGTYDILVFSQAVQTAGFSSPEEALDEAFGPTTADNLPWETVNWPIIVYTTDELRQAMKIPGAEIWLGDDLIVDDDKGTGFCYYAKYDNVINLNGHNIDVDLPGKEFYGVFYVLNGAQLDIVGNGDVTISSGVGQWIWCTGANGDTQVNIYGGNWVQNSKDFNANTDDYCEGIYANRKGNINIYGGTFDWETVRDYTINEADNGSGLGVVNAYAGTYVNYDPSVGHDSDGSYVPEGYEVISETQENGDIWYTVVKK